MESRADHHDVVQLPNGAETSKLWLLTDDIVVAVTRYWTTVWRLSTGECLNHWRMTYDLHGTHRLDNGNDGNHDGDDDDDDDDDEPAPPEPAWEHAANHMVDTQRWWLWQFGHKNALTYIWDLRDGSVITPSLAKWPPRAGNNTSFIHSCLLCDPSQLIICFDGARYACGTAISGWSSVIDPNDIYENNPDVVIPSLTSDVHAMYHWHHHDIIIAVTRSGIWYISHTHTPYMAEFDVCRVL